MKFEKYFIRMEDTSEGSGTRLVPTQYLKELNPHQAITELETYVEMLKANLNEYYKPITEDALDASEIPGLFKEAQKIAFELEIAEKYLAYLEKTYKTMH